MKVKGLTDEQLFKRLIILIEKALDCHVKNLRKYNNKYNHILYHVRKRDILGWGSFGKKMDPFKIALDTRIKDCDKKINDLKYKIKRIKGDLL